MVEDSREYAELAEIADLLDSTAEWENPFVPAPLGDTVNMECAWTELRESAAL